MESFILKDNKSKVFGDINLMKDNKTDLIGSGELVRTAPEQFNVMQAKIIYFIQSILY